MPRPSWVARRCRSSLAVAACGIAALIAGCATGGRAFPASTEPTPHVLGRAIAAIAAATTAGADSLAPDVLRTARQRLAAATADNQSRHTDRAALLAREAIADASYAKAVAERSTAERVRRAAASALEQSPPPRNTVSGPGQP